MGTDRTRSADDDDSRGATPRLDVHFARLAGRPLDGAPSTVRGRGRIELGSDGLVLVHRRPIAELPEWAVGMIVGGSVVFYVLLSTVADELLPESWRESGPIVPAMTAALVAWWLVRWVGPARAERVRLSERDVQAVLIDEDRRRALISTRGGQLIGFSADEPLGELRAYCAARWSRTLHEGPIHRHLVGRRTVILLAIVAAVALLLLWAPA